MAELDNLIRQAVAAEADERVDPRTVMAELQKQRRRRPLGLVIAAGAAAAAVAVTVAVVVPRTSPGPATTAASAPATPQTVLLMGIDEHHHADAIVLMRVGANGRISAASLPRDTLTMIEGRGEDRLNSAYASGYEEARGNNPDVAGAKRLAKTVETLTGQRVDHWASLPMASFGEVAEVVGGVEVCLKQPAKDSRSGADLPAGSQQLTAAQALAFLRQRFDLPMGDLDRVARQQAFLHSLAGKLLANPDKLDNVLNAVRPNIRTDEGFDVLGLAQQATADGMRTFTIPYLDPAADRIGLPVDHGTVRKFFTEFFVDQHPGVKTEVPSGTPCVN